MPRELIGQRIKFLMDSQGWSIRKFSRALDLSDTNIRNYIDKGTKPSSDVLEKIMQTFPATNPGWLLTGSGEPFLTPAESGHTTIDAQKNFKSPVAGISHGTSDQQQYSDSDSSKYELTMRLTFAQQEIESLRDKLARADALVAAKNELLDLLRGGFNRPN